MKAEWKKYPRSERAIIGQVECDVWPMGGGEWRYTVKSSESNVYLGSGFELSQDSAKAAAESTASAIQ